jgi:hypothetical protein
MHPPYPPFARGGKRPDATDFPPLAKGGGRGGESRGACNASENRSKIAQVVEAGAAPREPVQDLTDSSRAVRTHCVGRPLNIAGSFQNA